MKKNHKLTTILTKKDILDKWKLTIENSQFLWKVQAQENYSIIKKNTVDEAKKKLEEQYKKYKDMSLSAFILQAINDLESIGKDIKI
jgi:hypothetical protein